MDLSLSLGLRIGTGTGGGGDNLNSVLIPAASRNFPGGNLLTVSQTQARLIRKNTTGVDLGGLQFRCPNFYFNSLMAITQNPASVTVKIGVEYPVGSGRILASKGGSSSMVVASGALQPDYTFDTLAIDIPAGGVYALVVLAVVGNGNQMIIPGQPLLTALGESVETAFATQTLTDKTATGVVGGSGNTSNYYCPMIFGVPKAAGFKSVLMWGCDSLTAGLNETSQFTSDANGNIGLPCRYFGPDHGITNLARASSREQHWATADLSAYVDLLTGVTHNEIVNAGGRNDYAASTATATIVGYKVTNIAKAKTLGVWAGGDVWCMTTPPTTNTLSLSVSSLTSILTVATAVVSSTASLANGQTVLIAGATPTGYNGIVTIVVINGTTFTYTLPSGGSGLASATGTITASDNWSTLANSTVASAGQEVIRNSLNQAIIDKTITGQTKTLDLASYAQVLKSTSPNAYVWKPNAGVPVDGTSDGIHGGSGVYSAAAVSQPG